MTHQAQPWPATGAAVAQLERVSFNALPGFGEDALTGALMALQASAQTLLQGIAPGRPGVAPDATLLAVCQRARNLPRSISESEARAFFTEYFVPWRIRPVAGQGFVTGYYEPEMAGAVEAGADFAAPVLSRPLDLVTFAAGATPACLDSDLAAARRLPDGRLVPYATRAEIAAQRPVDCTALVWLRDAVEVFLMQVQGSARVRLPSGQVLRLGYAGRNGHPYVSIGRWLINAGEIAESDMSLARLKQWLRAQPDGGSALMQRNPSYVFFRFEEELDPALGPRAAASVQLTPLRSIAVDRGLWPYGLPFWLDANLPWQSDAATPLQRLMIAQDTGSAIVGPARADIFFGSGDFAGLRAGAIRHPASLYVLLPKAAA